MPDWYRCSDWNEQVEAEFFRRLKRARRHKSQYLVIQARILADTGRPELAAIALNLIELFLREHYNAVYAGGAFNTRARALLILEQWEEARQAFEDALAARRAMPNVIDDTWLEYPLAIARRRARDRYERALDILREFLSPGALVFPIQEFRFFATLALISTDEGDGEGASRWAGKALTAAAREAPFSRHPDVGVVGMADADLQIELEQLVTD